MEVYLLNDVSLVSLSLMFIVQLGSIVIAIVRLHGKAPSPFSKRGVSILQPVCGLENNLEETLRTSFQIDYPTYELLFCAASLNDQAVPIVKGLIAAFPSVNARLLVGNERFSENPKLNNLMKGWNAASYDLIVISDSNVWIPPDYIQRLMECKPLGTAFVCSPPVAVDIRGLAASIEAAFLNTYQARWQLTADHLGIGYVQGKTMMFSRQELEEYGGITEFATEAAEDAAASKIARRHNKLVQLVKFPFPQPLGSRSFSDVWKRQVRWAELRRRSFPLAYSAEITTGAALPTACYLILAANDGAPWAGLPALLVVWYSAEIFLATAYRWPVSAMLVVGSVLRDLLVPPSMDMRLAVPRLHLAR